MPQDELKLCVYSFMVLRMHAYFAFVGRHVAFLRYIVEPLTDYVLINGGTKNEDVLFLCQSQ